VRASSQPARFRVHRSRRHVSADALKGCRHHHQGERPEASELASIQARALVIAIMDPYAIEAALKTIAMPGVAAFAMEIDAAHYRAQGWTCASQANLAGYRAVIEAAEPSPRLSR